MGGAMSMFMSVSYADQQSQASSNCDNSGLVKNRWTLCVSQTTFLVPLNERAVEVHREKMVVYSEFISAQS